MSRQQIGLAQAQFGQWQIDDTQPLVRQGIIARLSMTNE